MDIVVDPDQNRLTWILNYKFIRSSFRGEHKMTQNEEFSLTRAKWLRKKQKGKTLISKVGFSFFFLLYLCIFSGNQFQIHTYLTIVMDYHGFVLVIL